MSENISAAAVTFFQKREEEEEEEKKRREEISGRAMRGAGRRGGKDGPPPPTYHHYRPAGDAVQVASPCLPCLTTLSICKCDVEAEQRKKTRRSPRIGKGKEEEKNTKGAAKVSSISTYSYEDGPHPDQPDPLVTLFLTIDEADELKKEYVDVTFGSSSVSVTIDLPGNRFYTFRRTSLYESIDPNESTWYLSKSKHRIVVKLAKIDAKKKWPGLTKVRRSFIFHFQSCQAIYSHLVIEKIFPLFVFRLFFISIIKVFAMVQHKNAFDYSLAAISGNTSHVTQKPKESQNIVSAKREYWDGPPKYTWNKYDRKYIND